MPLGRCSPEATTLTSRVPPLSTMAWILSLRRLETNTGPLSPSRGGGAFLRPTLFDDGVDLVLEAARDEHRALVAEPERARIVDAARIELDREALRGFELVDRKLVGGGRHGRGRNRCELLCGLCIGSADQGRRQRSWLLRRCRR